MIQKTATERFLVLHPEQAPAVKLIFDLYTNPDPEARMGATYKKEKWQKDDDFLLTLYSRCQNRKN
jgi:hypothetical protein